MLSIKKISIVELLIVWDKQGPKYEYEIINGSDTRINFNVDYGNYNIKHLDIQLNKELLAEEMDDWTTL